MVAHQQVTPCLFLREGQRFLQTHSSQQNLNSSPCLAFLSLQVQGIVRKVGETLLA